MSAAAAFIRRSTKNNSCRLRCSDEVAHALDWRKASAGTNSSSTILTLLITESRIRLAVAQHPSLSNLSSPMVLPSFTLEKRKRPVLFNKELDCILNDWHVAGIVVHWPIQQQQRCGKPCGHVLFVLDALDLNRPTCLWDPHQKQRSKESTKERIVLDDPWGRNPAYSGCNTTSPVIVAPNYFVKASETLYANADTTTVTDVWNDFARSKWPEVQRAKHTDQQQDKNKIRHSRSKQCLAPVYYMTKMAHDHDDEEAFFSLHEAASG
jgi:hypothetical protein